MISFTLNGKKVESSAEEDTPLLWVIRDELGLKGTKFGCGIGMCGACTVHLDGAPVRSCTLPVGSLANANITTIEGLAATEPHPLQVAWIAEQVPQCGYCQPGQIMQAAALLQTNPAPTQAQIDSHMSGNLCRCMSYLRIRKAIVSASRSMQTTATAGAKVGAKAGDAA